MPVFTSQIELMHPDQGTTEEPESSRQRLTQVELSNFLVEWRQSIHEGTRHQARQKRTDVINTVTSSVCAAAPQRPGESLSYATTLVGGTPQPRAVQSARVRGEKARRPTQQGDYTPRQGALFTTSYRNHFAPKPGLQKIAKRFNQMDMHRQRAAEISQAPRIPFVVPGHEATPSTETEDQFRVRPPAPPLPKSSHQWMGPAGGGRKTVSFRPKEKEKESTESGQSKGSEGKGEEMSDELKAYLKRTEEKLKPQLSASDRLLASAKVERRAFREYKKPDQRKLPAGRVPHPPPDSADDMRVFPLWVCLPTDSHTFSLAGLPSKRPTTTVREGYARPLGRRRKFNIVNPDPLYLF